ncbi:MAG: type II toxin-antitoxin system VapC family toxin [Bradyrhizobium sp.]
MPEALLRTPVASAVEKWLFEPSQTPHDVLLPRVWDLRSHFTAFDAMYVARAEVLDAPLPTCDKRLAASPRPSGAHRVGMTASVRNRCGLKPGLNTVAAAPICEQEIGQMGI